MNVRKVIATLVISAAGVTAIVQHEGYKGAAYIPVKGDVPTIGYGSTTYQDGQPVKMGDTITREKAENLLQGKLKVFEKGVQNCVRVPLFQNEFDAYVSLSYNIGITAFCQSTLVKKLNNYDYEGACMEILRWNKFKGTPLKGLTNRRQQEYVMCVGSR